MNVVTRLESSTNVVDPFTDGHADIISCHHASANAGERSVRAVDYNIMRSVGVAQQIHILIGLQDKIAFGVVSAKDFNFFILICRMQYQNIQTAVRIKIGKFRIPANTCPHAYQ